MHEFSRILLHMNLVDANHLRPRWGIDLHPAIIADRQIELRDLVVLRIIRIEIVFTVEAAVRVYLAVGGQSYRYRQFYHTLIENRQRAGHSGTYRAGVGIRRTAKGRGTSAEDLRLRRQFHMNFQSDHGFILYAHQRASFLPHS